MPQLNPLDWAPQLIWLILTFGILYLLMVWVALPRIGVVIETRAAHIAADLASGNKGQRELIGVDALANPKIEPIQSAGPNLDQHFVRPGLGPGQLGPLEDLRSPVPRDGVGEHGEILHRPRTSSR